MYKIEITAIEDLELDTIKEAALPIIKEAIENPNCKVYQDSSITIIASVPYIAEQNSEYYGLWLSIYSKGSYSDEVFVWIARQYGSEFVDDIDVGEYPFTMSLDEIITKATNDCNRCDFCKQSVGLKNLTRIAFANKACPNCVKKAKEALEYPGWNN